MALNRNTFLCWVYFGTTHPDGTDLQLLDPNTEPFACAVGTVTAIFPDTWPSFMSFSRLHGKPVEGTWVLHVSDEGFSRATGVFTIESWILELTVQP